MIRKSLVLWSTLLCTFAPAAIRGAAPAAGECVPIRDLQPRIDAGRLARLGPGGGADAPPERWSAARGDTLRLILPTGAPGDHQVFLRAAPAAGVSLSARLWGFPLTRRGESRLPLQGPAEDGLLELRLDPLPLGPGYQRLVLEALAGGEVDVACVGLRRTGEMTAAVRRPAPEGVERPFLGVQLGASRDGGTRIDGVVPDTAAARAGLQAGDVVLQVGGATTPSSAALTDAIRSLSVGARVEVQLLRDGERLSREAVIGARPDELVTRRDHADHVLEVLQVRPGQTVADLGCGSGWLSEAIAAAVGEDGRVYAVEIQEEHVARLHRRAPPNVVPVLSAEDDVFLPEDSLDTAMLHDVASHIDRDARRSFYDSVRRALKPGGRLVVFGPHGDAEGMLRVLRENGFVPVDAAALQDLSSSELDARLDAGIAFRDEGEATERRINRLPAVLP